MPHDDEPQVDAHPVEFDPETLPEIDWDEILAEVTGHLDTEDPGVPSPDADMKFNFWEISEAPTRPPAHRGPEATDETEAPEPISPAA